MFSTLCIISVFVMSLLIAPPSVFAVGRDYWICALAGSECTMGVEIAGSHHWDHSNGTLRSRRILHEGCHLHMARVPQTVLDAAGSYTLHLRRIVERKPYFTECGETESPTFSFRPCAVKSSFKIINLADAHNLVDAPIAAGRHFGDALDLLVLNGDIPNHSGDLRYFETIYQIAGRVTDGACPCIFARGNHDMRGNCAELLADHVPTNNGLPYFTFRAGPIWGVVLDAAEDKPDDFPEYGHTICAHDFRLEEDAWLDRMLVSHDWRGAALRLIISHKPLAHEIRAPFDIEKDLYRNWCAKLKKIRPHLHLSGHLHECFVERPGGGHDDYGLPCLHVCSSLVRTEEPVEFTCGAVTIDMDGVRPFVHVDFVDNKGTVKHVFDGEAGSRRV